MVFFAQRPIARYCCSWGKSLCLQVLLTYCIYADILYLLRECHLSSFKEKHWTSFQSYSSLKWSFNASDHTTVLLHVCSNSTALFINTGDAIEPSRWDCKNNHSGSEQRLWPIYPSISSHLSCTLDTGSIYGSSATWSLQETPSAHLKMRRAQS